MENSQKPLLSVIVVNRNTADLLTDCLTHIYDSNLPDTPEVIVVDNGSTDDSVARVRKEFPQVCIKEVGKNLGFAAANNLAMKEASGDFLLLVNTDALLERDCAHRLMELLKEHPQAGMAGPQLLNEDGSRQTSYEAVPTLASETLNRSLLKRLFPSRFPGKHRVVLKSEEVEALIGAVMMVRRKALEQINGFDEDYFFFLEETDVAVRMAACGWRVMHEPRAKAVHLQGATAGQYQIPARIEFYRSRYIFFRKHYGNASARFLKMVLVANLTLNVLVLGCATLITLGRVDRVASRFRVRATLWKWHLQGCSPGPGLPRD